MGVLVFQDIVRRNGAAAMRVKSVQIAVFIVYHQQCVILADPEQAHGIVVVAHLQTLCG